jgi:isoleucyl-tRNA synthetase
VTEAYENYDVLKATRPIEAFVEKMSTWYLRRSRRRFWKSESDSDKQAAYSTLYTALVTVAKLLAPSMPFLAEELYQNLVHSVDESAPESVHLAEWPEVLPEMIDQSLNRDMALVMRLVSLGHSARQKANRKVRQPLAEAAFSVGNASERKAVETYADLFTDLTPELAQEGLAREFVRRVQDLRKSAELDVADRIELFVEASAGLKSAIEAHQEYITTETLTSNLVFGSLPEGVSVAEDAFDGEKIRVGLRKK